MFDYDCNPCPRNTTIVIQADVCVNDDFEHMSVGHIQLTDANYSKFKKEVMATSKIFVLGASDSSCDQCCFTEELLSNLKILFDTKKYTGRVSPIETHL